MHGRINYFSAKAGIGSIINNLKKAFDFKMSHWHDTSTIPSIGMYVTYLLDDKGRLTDVKASKYQSFKNHPFLLEVDFWATDDDSALEDLEERKREDLVNNKMKTLELQRVTSIPVTKTEEECLKLIFAKHYDVMEANESALSKKDDFEFDYFALKRFLDKTLMQLVTLDKRITMDEFNDLKQQLVELEFMYNYFVKVADPERTELVKNYYLRFQIDYTAIRRAGSNLNDNINMLANKSRNLESDLANIQNKLPMVKDKDVKAKMEADFAKKSGEKIEIDADLEAKKPVLERVKGVLQEFEQSSLASFPKFYKDEKERLRLAIRKIINHLGDEFDTRIYKKSTQSDVITSSFYSQNIDGAFCTMTFVKYYVMRLNKELMQEPDKILYEMLKAYERAKVTRVAVVCENQSTIQRLKIFVLSQSKHIRIAILYRAMEFYSVCEGDHYSAVLIDANLRGAEPQEVVERGRASNRNKGSTYIVFEG